MVTRIEIQQIDRDDACYPPLLTDRMGVQTPSPLAAIGSLQILRHQRLGLICSIRCPGSIVIKTFDAIRQLRDAGIVLAGGFHSPMENECLDFLLRGEQPVIVCPAKGLGRPRCPARGERRSTPSGCSCFPHSATPSPAPPPPRPKPATNSSPRSVTPSSSPTPPLAAKPRPSRSIFWSKASLCLRFPRTRTRNY